MSERAYSDADLKKLNEPSVSYRDKMYTEYELSQMQRAMEREIRKQKRAVLAAKEGIDAAETDDVRASSRGQILARYTTHVRQNPNSRSGKQQLFTQESVKLKREERKLREFLQETGLQPENARLWVHGFGRSVSQRAVWANKKILQFLDQSDIMSIDNIMSDYRKYIQKYPDSGFNYYMIGYKLKAAGITKGVALPAKPKNAAVLADSAARHDPYHIMHRMVERNITDDDLRLFMNEAKVMFVQWNGQRQVFYSDAGAVVITKSSTGWIFKTAFSKTDYDEESFKILEVIHKYVDG